MKQQYKKLLIVPMFFMIIAICFLCGKFENPYPRYVTDSIDVVANKMSNSYGLTDCDASKNARNRWVLNCTPEGSTANFEFLVLPSSMSPYKTPFLFYLIANNTPARIASRESADEGLMSYLQINHG